MLVRLLLAVTVAWGWIASAQDNPRSDRWQSVEEAVKKDRPRTAIKQLEAIQSAATAAGAHAEAVKALAWKLNQRARIEGTKAEEKITRLEEALETATPGQRPVVQALLGRWYWQFFQQNRWRFMQRTQTATPPGEDILTWDSPRLFREVAKHYEAALAERDRLLAIPLEDWADLLDLGEMPHDYRPTLYDFLAFDAIDVYDAGEQLSVLPQDAFVLDVESPVFGSADEFLGWSIEATDTDSPVYKGIKLLQEVMAVHRDDADRSAFYDANLRRLHFANVHAVGPDKTERYIAALAEFAKGCEGHVIASRARAVWAQELLEYDRPGEAHEVAKTGFGLHPDSPGGVQCFNIVKQIERPSVAVSTERVWNAPWPDITVDYKNLTDLHLRVVKLDWNERLSARGAYQPERLNGRDIDALLALVPVREWTATLPATPDYRMRRESLTALADLEPGFYALIASPDDDFGEDDNVVSGCAFWRSDLALVTHSGGDWKAAAGFVLNAVSGEPVNNAGVTAWRYNRNNREWEQAAETRTDTEGEFRLGQDIARQSIIYLVEDGGQRLASNPRSFHHRNRHRRNEPRTVLFTDRALYRPGQTVRYKGICLRTDRDENNYTTLENRRVDILFRDANGKEAASNKHVTNDYGSFSGSFTAPAEGVTGRMSLYCANPKGHASIRIEEYKRPKFRVNLDAPDDAPKLGESVTLSGTAESYTGAPIDSAEVRYRVVRRVHYPPWIGFFHWWWPPHPAGGSQEIAHGSARTGADGRFEITFPALPDRAVPPENEPVFHYAVTADVTDATGETRSGTRTVQVGYKALKATVSAPGWIEAHKPFEVTVRTTTLGGDPEAASGTVQVYALRAPDRVHRKALQTHRPFLGFRRGNAARQAEPEPDLSDPNTWELGEVVAESAFETDATGKAVLEFALSTGHYRVKLSTKDRFGGEVKALQPLRVLDPDAAQCRLKIPFVVDAPSWSAEPGETFSAVWGTGYATGRAFVEITHRGKVLQRYWTDPERTQVRIAQEVTEAMRGGFHVHVTMVRENRLYLVNRKVQVPWSNKQLSIEWETFRSNLKPGQDETWTAVVKGPDAAPAVAEFAAALYDASLDAFAAHGWSGLGNLFYQDYSTLRRSFENQANSLQRLRGRFDTPRKSHAFHYPSFPVEVVGGHHRLRREYGFGGGGGFGSFGSFRPVATGMAMPRMAAMKNAVPVAMESGDVVLAGEALGGMADSAHASPHPAPEPAAPNVDLDIVAARTNLNETAFFFPHLTAGEDGTVRMEFTMPEALTEWRFLGLAHDRELRSGLLNDTVKTSKDLMVRPNPPRFLREGDELAFTVKVVNQSPTRQTGSVRLTFRDARTNDPRDAALGNVERDQAFDIPAGESRTYAWRVAVPDGLGVLVYKTVASTGRLSDGEEDYLPVVPRRILVHESLPLHVRGPNATREFTLDKLAKSGESDTLRHQSLTVQMVSNPAWYAVLALPYLMEFPHEGTEQTFHRAYANALAGFIANSDPKIRGTFDQWRGTDALDSPLEKNEELKSILLTNTPWVRQAEDESQARRNVGILFEENRLRSELSRAMRKLEAAQYSDGAWPWFPGGRRNEFITRLIVSGFGRLRHLGVREVDPAMAVQALGYLDGKVHERYRRILEHGNEEANHLDSGVAHYLYARSFFLRDRGIADEHREAVEYFLGQAETYWVELGSRMSQAHVALALQRFGRGREAPNDIVVSIRERAKRDEELGMYWRDLEFSWWWHRAPIETQAMMIELFDEVAKAPDAVEACKVWLLKQKQTQDWKTTKATANAVYALLLRGTDLLADDTLTTVAVGGETVQPKNVEAGTGFYMKRYSAPEVRADMARVTVRKDTPGVSWGGVHWQYFESVEKITPHEATPLTLRKTLYVERPSKKGPTLHKLANSALQVGDKLVVRVELRTDRDMEYVHMKDARGSGLEPVNVLSKYRYQDGLRYYESTRDTATHFYIDYLPKGTYVFQYPLRVQHRGAYQSGMAHIECMYAPEFNSHSESTRITVE